MEDMTREEFDEMEYHLTIIEEFVRMTDQEIRELEIRTDIARRFREIRAFALELEKIRISKEISEDKWSDRPKFRAL